MSGNERALGEREKKAKNTNGNSRTSFGRPFGAFN